MLIDAHLNKSLTEEFVKQLKIQSNKNTKSKVKNKNLLSICNLCDYISKNEHGLNVHKGRMHSDKNLSGMQSNETTSALCSTRVKDNTNFKMFTCPECNIQCNDDIVLNNHIFQKHDQIIQKKTWYTMLALVLRKRCTLKHHIHYP